MLKENAMPKSMSMYDRFKPISPLRATEKDGLATSYGIKCMQDRVTMEGNHNLLFGTVKGSPVGVCHNTSLTNRNMNAFVLKGDTDKGWKNYILPNLMAGHSSAVVVGDSEIFNRYGTDILKKGINIFLAQFSDSDVPTNQYNPFALKYENQQKFHCAAYMAHAWEELAHSAKNELIRTKGDTFDKELAENIYHVILQIAFVYTAMSEKIQDSERNFRTVERILLDIKENGKLKVLEYLMPDTLSLCISKDQLRDDWQGIGDAVFREILIALLDDFSPLAKSTFFMENKDIPRKNITVEKLVNEPTYLFIPTPKTAEEKAMTGFFLTTLLKELYVYGESDWKHCGMLENQALENPVCFYLDDFAEYDIPNFINILATCRVYGIGLSVIARSVQDIRSKYSVDSTNFDNAECLFANVDTNLILDFTDESDYDYISKRIPVYLGVNGKKIPAYKRGNKRFYRIAPALSEQELRNLFAEDKTVVIIRDFYPLICDTLKSDN